MDGTFGGCDDMCISREYLDGVAIDVYGWCVESVWRVHVGGWMPYGGCPMVGACGRNEALIM